MQKINPAWQDVLAFFDSTLFKAVQTEGLFADSKTFADARALAPFADIMLRYESEHNAPDFTLSEFVSRHFELPAPPPQPAQRPDNTVSGYVSAMWDVLTRQPDSVRNDSLIPLQHAYLVPGGRFREIYYWDSYFSSVGLVQEGKHGLVINMLENFLDIQAQIGCIPNGNRAYYHSRSQPPILALLYRLVEDKLDSKQKQRAIAGMEAEYAFWMTDAERLDADTPASRRVVKLSDGSLLNRYYDTDATPRPESYREDACEARELSATEAEAFYRNLRAACESGWDFSSRWLARQDDLMSVRTTEIVPVDLNALLYMLEDTLADVSSRPEYFKKAAVARKKAINTHLWNEQKGFFFDLHLPTQTQTSTWSLAGCVPMYAGLVSSHQAQCIADHLQTSFLKAGGLVTTLNATRQQWDSPNGWAPLQWFAVKGLRRYGHTDLAVEIIQRWNGLLEEYYRAHGVMLEKYNVCDTRVKATGGEYEVQLGFGWTNGVYAAFKVMLNSHNA